MQFEIYIFFSAGDATLNFSKMQDMHNIINYQYNSQCPRPWFEQLSIIFFLNLHD